MTTPANSPPAQERGFVLIVALVLLLVLTILGLAAAQTTSLEERMAGNARNHSMAFEAGEAGLSAAYSGILQGLWSNAQFAGNSNGLYLLSTCCGASGGYTSAWTVSGAWGTALPITSAVSGLNNPRGFPATHIPCRRTAAGGAAGQQFGRTAKRFRHAAGAAYRITVYATGGDQTTHVILQAVATQ